MLERTPPELASDVIDRGIALTGGGSMLRHMDDLLLRETGVPVHVAEQPMQCVALRAGASLDYRDVTQRAMPTDERALRGAAEAPVTGARLEVTQTAVVAGGLTEATVDEGPPRQGKLFLRYDLACMLQRKRRLLPQHPSNVDGHFRSSVQSVFRLSEAPGA